MTNRDALRAALAPKSVAIVGASDNPDKNRRGARTRYRRSRPFADSAPASAGPWSMRPSAQR